MNKTSAITSGIFVALLIFITLMIISETFSMIVGAFFVFSAIAIGLTLLWHGIRGFVSVFTEEDQNNEY